jgi:5-methylcytosine-specific restriction protein A
MVVIIIPKKSNERRWLSLYEYRKLYPDENIFYEKPDFREDKRICKWCGKPLKNKRQLSFCCSDCRDLYDRVTTWDRGTAPLPYKILCRDKFICQRCGKFIGMVNEYGMKIPTPKEAEVHHIKPVSKGGSDNQFNLISLCKECHNHIHNEK